MSITMKSLLHSNSNPLLNSPSSDFWSYLTDRVGTWGAIGPLLGLISALAAWALSLPGVSLSAMTDLGLVSVLPPLFYVGLAILTVSFAWTVRTADRPGMLGAHILVLIIIIHATPVLLEGTLRYAWAWKHVGIVDYIQRHGQVDPGIEFLNAYHNWPGFFALNALLTEAAGFQSALSYAAWAPAFFNLIDLGALLLIYQAATTDRRLVWFSAWFFYLTNWIGQDYFAPQAFAYFLYLVIIGICLTWFGDVTGPDTAMLKRWLRFDRLATAYRWLITSDSSEAPAAPATPFQRAGLLIVLVFLFMTIASSHQLTPFMVIAALLGLVIFQRCGARTLPVLMGALTGTWIVFMAADFMRHGNTLAMLESLGHLFSNINANLIDLSRASPGQKLIAWMSRGLSLTVGILALAGGLRRLRAGYRDVGLAWLVLAPLPLIAGNSYGGEMLFRIYFFALPFLAFFGAALIYPTPEAGHTWRSTGWVVVLSGVLLFGFFFAYYGKERMFYFTPAEVDAAEYLYDAAPANSLIIDASANYPWAFTKYENYDYNSLTELTPAEQDRLWADPVGEMADMMGNRSYAATYLILTRSQKANVEMLGLMPPGALDQLIQALRRSSQFQEIYRNADADIFTLASSAGGLL